MPSGSYNQCYVQCPFYLADDGASQIRCEGFGRARSLTLTYRFKRHFERKILDICCDKYKTCEIYRGLMENKYADTGKEIRQ